MKQHTSFSLFWLLFASIVCLGGPWSSVSVAADAKPFRVKLRVTAEADLQSQAMSYLSRELRALHDVELVDTEPHWQLGVIVEHLQEQGTNHSLGVVVSTVILEPFSSKDFVSYLKTWLPQEEQAAVLLLTEGLYFEPHRWVHWGPHLEALCKKIIAEFDTRIVESSRAWRRQLEEATQKRRENVEALLDKQHNTQKE